jgi:hypothetical protein
MGKQLIVGQVGPHFNARITIQNSCHGNMVMKNIVSLKKNDYCTNNVSSKKGRMNNCFGPIYLPK